MIESIKDLAHELQEVCYWADDNQPAIESHLSQIVQSSMNMPTALRSGMGKGLVYFIPSRHEGGFGKFRDSVLRQHPGCNLDTNFNNLNSGIIFGICQEQGDKNFIPPSEEANKLNPWKIKRDADENTWWSETDIRTAQFGTPIGNKDLPYWIKDQIVCYSMSLAAAALESRRLGYHVQHLTIDKLAVHVYKNYPNLIDRPWIPLHGIFLGTKAERVKMSHRRNRSYEWVKDHKAVIKTDEVPESEKVHYEYDDKYRCTPNSHEPYLETYTPK